MHICYAIAFLTNCSRLDSLDWSTGRSAYGQLPTSPYSIDALQLVATSKIEDNVSDRKHAFRKRYTRPRCPIVTRDISHMKHIYLNCPTWLTAMQWQSRLTHQFSAYAAHHASFTSTVDYSWRVPSSSQRRGPSRLPYERTAAERLTREGCSSEGALRASEGRDRCYSRHFNFSFPGEGETKTKRERKRGRERVRAKDR